MSAKPDQHERAVGSLGVAEARLAMLGPERPDEPAAKRRRRQELTELVERLRPAGRPQERLPYRDPD